MFGVSISFTSVRENLIVREALPFIAGESLLCVQANLTFFACGNFSGSILGLTSLILLISANLHLYFEGDLPLQRAFLFWGELETDVDHLLMQERPR